MGSREHSEPSSAEQTKQRNKIRGVLGRGSSRNASSGQVDTKLVYRRGIRRVLMEARSRLHGLERDSFFHWFNDLANASPIVLGRAVALEPLESVIKGRRISFAEELDWITRRIQPHFKILREFRRRVDALDNAFWRADKQGVWDRVNEIEAEFGRSFWLIETRLGLEQYFNGIEAQKAYAAELRTAFHLGLPAYLAYMLSIRNEPRSTLNRFVVESSARINKMAVSPDTKAYLRYRLCDEFTGTERDVLAILRGEQAQSIIDLYETMIDAAQKLVTTNKVGRYERSLKSALGSWTEIEDYRVPKLLCALGVPVTQAVALRSDATLARCLNGDIVGAYRSANKALRSCPKDVWAGIEAAFCLSTRGLVRDLRNAPAWTFVIGRLAVLMVRGDQFEQASGELTKFARNLQTLPTAKAVLDLARHITTAHSERSTLLTAPCLNASAWGGEDLELAVGSARDELKGRLQQAHRDHAVAFWTGHVPPEASAAVAAAHAYIVGRAALRSNKAEGQLEVIKPLLRRELPAALCRALSLLAIDTAVVHSDIETAVTLAAIEAVLSEQARASLPVNAVVGSRTWEELEVVQDKLALAIVFDLLLRRTNDDSVATFLRFAFEEYMASSGLARPSQIPAPKDTVERLKLVYFLRHVCVSSNMDMYEAFQGSRDLEDERIQICERLAEIDPVREEEYETEAETLRNRLLIQDGIKLVDSSRIHVDVGAISRLAEQSLSENFLRYRALVEAGIGVASDFDMVLRETVKGPEKESEYFYVPTNEADQILADLILTLRDEFLKDPAHGLNFYLSKRIRHGVLAGYLRSPIEETSLITQRESESTPYRPNEYWLSQLTFLSAHDRDNASIAFDRFAADVDGWIKEVKDDYLQIRDKDHPKGLFEIAITAPQYHLIRSAIQQSLTFPVFLQSCFAIFWAMLEPSLAAAQGLLVIRSKERFTRAFDALHEAIRGCAEQDDAFHNFSAVIRNTSAEVQRQLDMMSDWLRRTEVQQVTHRLTTEQVIDIGIEYALKAHKTFRPRIVKELVGPSYGATVSVLVTVSDILFILFDNIFKYARSNDPRVSVRFETDLDAEVVTITVTNEAAGGVRTNEVEAELGRIRQSIETRSFEGRVQREGKSGFFKIANLVHRSQRGAMRFGFLDNDDFCVEIALAVVVAKGKSEGEGIMPEGDPEDAYLIG